MKIDSVSENLNPLDFWGYLGWEEIADGLDWTDHYDDNNLYLLITKDFETPVIALFKMDYGGVFTVHYHSGIQRKYYYLDCNDIRYIAEMPTSAEVIESIKCCLEGVYGSLLKEEEDADS